MNKLYEDLDEYEDFETERRRRSAVDGDLLERRLERALREKKRLRKRLIRARQQARRGMGRRRPPNREE